MIIGNNNNNHLTTQSLQSTDGINKEASTPTEKKTVQSTTISLGSKTYHITNGAETPTKRVESIRDVMQQSLEKFDSTSLENAKNYFEGRSAYAATKAKELKLSVSHPRVASVIKKAPFLLKVINAASKNTAATLKGDVETLQTAKEWKKEANVYRQLSSELAARTTSLALNTEIIKNTPPVALPEKASSFFKTDSQIQEKQKAINECQNSSKSDDVKEIQINKLNRELERLERQAVAQNYDTFSTELVSQIPNVALQHSANTNSLPQSRDLNNNGMLIDRANITPLGENQASIDRDGQEVPLIPVKEAVIDGTNHTMAQGFGYYDASSGMLYMDKEDSRYHDHVIVSGGNGKPAVMSLADGSGHGENARPMAKSIAEKSHNHVAQNIGHCNTLHSMLKLQLEGVKRANDETASNNIEGQTTYIQTAIVGNVLSGVSIGDSKVFVFRPKPEGGWLCMDPLKNSKGTLDAKEAGGQLNGIKEDNGKYTELNKTVAFAMILEEGDVVFSCSDGFVDNFNPSINHTPPSQVASSDSYGESWELDNHEHIELAQKYSQELIEKEIKSCKTGEEISNSLSDFIQKNTKEKKIQFLTNPSRNTEKNFAGKLDDAASCFMVYNTQKNT